jgi:hypothetical protein
MALMAIMMTVGIVRLGRAALFLAEDERIARCLVADLRYAQSEAIAKGKNHYLYFTLGITKFTSYKLCRVEAGGNVQIEPARVFPDTVAVTGLLTRAEFTPGGDALAAYTYTVTCPGRTYQITVTLATGAVILRKL